MTPASRNLWIELAACGAFLIGLIFFLVAGYYTAMFTIHGMLPNEPPIQVGKAVFGRRDLLVAVLSASVPGAAAVAAAWGLLRSLLAEEESGDE